MKTIKSNKNFKKTEGFLNNHDVRKITHVFKEYRKETLTENIWKFGHQLCPHKEYRIRGKFFLGRPVVTMTFSMTDNVKKALNSCQNFISYPRQK